jgi:hypothetical protein
MQNGLSIVEFEGRKVFEITDFNRCQIDQPIQLAIVAAKSGVEPKVEPHPEHPKARIISYPLWQAGWAGNMTVTSMTAPQLIEHLRRGRGENSPDNQTVVAATV